MATERSCEQVREGLEEALLARGEIGRAEHEHLGQCPDCAAAADRLRSLAAALDSLPAPEPRPELLAATRARARAALAQAGAAAPATQARGARAQRGEAERRRAPAKQGRKAAAQRGEAERRWAPAKQGRKAAAQRGKAERRWAPAKERGLPGHLERVGRARCRAHRAAAR